MIVDDRISSQNSRCVSPSGARFELLNEQFGIPGVARILAGNGGFPKVRITTDLAQGEIYLYGAQVTSWIPAGCEEVLFLSNRSRWEAGYPIRGGIPICFPWFSDKKGSGQAPKHGFVRTREWRIDSIALQNDGSVAVVCKTESDHTTHPCWPHRFQAFFSATFGRTLRLEFTVINEEPRTVSFEEALHTYLRVGRIEDIEIHGLDEATYLDFADSGRKKVQTGQVKIVSLTNRVYDTQNPLAVHDAMLKRVLRTEKRNSKSTIIWNPWRTETKELHDLHPSEWQQMICVETGNVLSNGVSLLPGEKWTTCATLTVDP